MLGVTQPLAPHTKLGAMNLSNPCVYYEDFLGASVLAGAYQSTIRAQKTGTIAVSMAPDVPGGVLRGVTGTGAGDAGVLHPQCSFKVPGDASGRELVFETRCKITSSTANLHHFYCGLEADASGAIEADITGSTRPAYQLLFQKASASLDLKFRATNGANGGGGSEYDADDATAGALTDTGFNIVNGTYFTVAMHVLSTRGTCKVQIYVDGELKITYDDQIPKDAIVVPCVYIEEAGGAEAVTLDCDYILCAETRV